MTREELVAVLKAYRVLQQASFPHLNPTLAARAASWGTADVETLRRELAQYVRETEAPGNQQRIFWKLGADLAFAGCNAQLLQDAGLARVSDIVGRTDFDPVFSWSAQAAKYRKDDLEVMASGQERVNIVERQKSANGTHWLRTSKAPIRLESGKVVGIMGMYDVIDAATASQLMFK